MRLAWFFLFSPNPQMHFVLFDHGRSSELEAETPGQCKHCCKRVCGCKQLPVSGRQRQGMRKGKGNRKSTEGPVRNAMIWGKHTLPPLQRLRRKQLRLCCRRRGDACHPQSPILGCSLELNSICAGLSDSTLPPGAPAGLHTSALVLSQSSDVMHYLARRCF